MDLRKLSRREILLGLISAPLGAISLTSAYAGYIEPANYDLSENDVVLPSLPQRFEGFRIAQISDVHHCRLVGLSEVQRIVTITNQAKPDLVVLTGDYTTTYRRFIEPCAEALGQLIAPEGVWAVLGNHDHYTDPQLTAWALERNKIVVLNNANSRIRRGQDFLQLAGIDDWSWNQTDWRRALYNLDTDSPSILLSHQPTVLDLAQTEGIGLILSGHTHGGQVNLPFLGAPVRFASREFKYLRGRYSRNKTQLYVSRGTGVIGLGVRFGATPEIAIHRLRTA